jgi:DHA1 family bicyclomycin/chloramphenicol resistance-like MFS transporter
MADRHRLGTGEFVALMATLTSLVALSIDSMLPALSSLGHDLGVTSANAPQWVVTSFLLGLAVGQMVYGPISDSVGRKPPVYFGLVIFAAGSVLCLMATTFPTMLAGRLLQGLGVAAPRNVSIALIRDLHAGREMARIMSMIMAIFILVPIIAPSFGQLMLTISSWRSIFAAFLVLALISGTWFALRQPETLHEDHRKPFSPLGILRTFGQVLRTRPALGFTITAGVSSGAFIGYLNSAQQLFQQTYGVGTRFALYFALLAATIGLAGVLNGRLVGRWGMYHLSMLALRGLTVFSFAFWAYAWSRDGVPEFAAFLGYLLSSFFCVGILFGNMNALAMEELGDIAGVGASLVASLSLLIALVLGAAIGQLYDGTVIPLAVGYSLLSLASLPIMAWAERGRSIEGI